MNEEQILDSKRQALGQLIVKEMSLEADMRIAYEAGNHQAAGQLMNRKSGLRSQILDAEAEVYRAEIAHLDALRKSLLLIAAQQLGQISQNPDLMRIYNGLQNGINEQYDKDIERAKQQLADNLKKKRD